MEETEKLIQSNAKAIEALTADIQEMKRDRDYMYRLMGDLTNKIAILTNAQAESYETMKNLDDRQGQLADQQRQLSNQQQQLIEIIKSLAKEKN